MTLVGDDTCVTTGAQTIMYLQGSRQGRVEAYFSALNGVVAVRE